MGARRDVVGQPGALGGDPGRDDAVTALGAAEHLGEDVERGARVRQVDERVADGQRARRRVNGEEDDDPIPGRLREGDGVRRGRRPRPFGDAVDGRGRWHGSDLAA